MQLTFYNSTATSIPLDEMTISLNYQAEQLTECRITWQSSSEQYQQIDRYTLFNLKPELRSSTTVEFSDNSAIEIKATKR
ncbi:MAG: hypothetical protein HC780_14895 [Leptolyngbyaceae cyanobacterium CSU_1_3]|nr:hypothetical protein [Leptolyngbyaceae cyanobacterium CSU_1_3]